MLPSAPRRAAPPLHASPCVAPGRPARPPAAQITDVSLRQVSAVSSTFIWEGILQYAWRDDSLAGCTAAVAGYCLAPLSQQPCQNPVGAVSPNICPTTAAYYSAANLVNNVQASPQWAATDDDVYNTGTLPVTPAVGNTYAQNSGYATMYQYTFTGQAPQQVNSQPPTLVANWRQVQVRSWRRALPPPRRTRRRGSLLCRSAHSLHPSPPPSHSVDGVPQYGLERASGHALLDGLKHGPVHGRHHCCGRQHVVGHRHRARISHLPPAAATE